MKNQVVIRKPENHNPDYFIAELQIDNDIKITCAKSLKSKECVMEYYKGENYVVDSKAKSYSKVYREPQIPEKYKSVFLTLKEICINEKV